MNHCTEGEATLRRLEIAIRHGQRALALSLLDQLREDRAAAQSLSATVDCALIELGNSTAQADLERFVARIAAGLDHDAHQ